MSTPEGIADALRARAEAATRKAADKEQARKWHRLQLAMQLITSGDYFDLRFEPLESDPAGVRMVARNALAVADILIDESSKPAEVKP